MSWNVNILLALPAWRGHENLLQKSKVMLPRERHLNFFLQNCFIFFKLHVWVVFEYMTISYEKNCAGEDGSGWKRGEGGGGKGESRTEGK